MEQSLQGIEHLLEQMSKQNLDKIELASKEFPEKLVKVLSHIPNTNKHVMQEWRKLGPINLNELVTNSKCNSFNTPNGKTTTEEYLKYQHLCFGGGLDFNESFKEDGSKFWG